MIEKFSDPNGGFFDTPHDGEALLIRPKDISDNATPSGNALACEVLLKLAAYTDNGKYRDLAEQALALVGDSALRHPLGFARWLKDAPALLNDRPLVDGKATAYICEGFVCKQPATDLEIFKAQLNL